MYKNDMFKILKASFTIIICVMTLLVNLTISYFKEFESYEILFSIITISMAIFAIVMIQTIIENLLFVIGI